MVQSNEYYPFGGLMASSTVGGVQPYKYGGKELDDNNSLNLYDFSARYQDPMIPTFTTIDPHAENYYSWSPYAYVMNNPMRWIDKYGLDPGDPFESTIKAANDFAKYYNGISINMNVEFSSLIYQNTDGTFSYNVARIGGEGWSVPNLVLPEGAIRVGGIHSHGGDDPRYDSYSLSVEDKEAADRKGVNEFVVTPAGELLEYDVESKDTFNRSEVAVDIPSDPKSGNKRINKIDPKDTKPYYIEIEYTDDRPFIIIHEYNKPNKKQ